MMTLVNLDALYKLIKEESEINQQEYQRLENQYNAVVSQNKSLQRALLQAQRAELNYEEKLNILDQAALGLSEAELKNYVLVRTTFDQNESLKRTLEWKNRLLEKIGMPTNASALRVKHYIDELRETIKELQGKNERMSVLLNAPANRITSNTLNYEEALKKIKSIAESNIKYRMSGGNYEPTRPTRILEQIIKEVEKVLK